jgi:hypothetical protein
MLKYYFIILFCVINLGNAQDISGLWVHDQGGKELTGLNDIYALMYLSVNNSGDIKGYTYDYHAGSSCSFSLEGEFDYDNQQLTAVNTKKINKAFFHGRARYKLIYKSEGDNVFLIGKARQKGIHGFLFSFGGALSVPLKYRKIQPENYEGIKGYEELKTHIDTLKVNFQTEVNAQSILEAPLVEEADKEEEIRAITNEKERRKNELINSHKVSLRKITIEVSDNNRTDGDRITVFVNDKLIEYNLEVTKIPKRIEVFLNDDQKVHNVFFVANNVGRVSPNTAKIKYSLDGITFEEVLFTNLRTNKYLKFISN